MTVQNARGLAALTLGALGSLTPLLALAQVNWVPTKQVTLLVPYNPGGGTDATARAVAKELASLWKVPVIVENLSGADGLIGTRKVMDASPDGTTLLVQVPSIVLMKYQRSLKGIDPLHGLKPVTSIATSPTALVVGGRQPVKNIEDLVALCKSASAGCSAGSGENSSKVRAQLFAWYFKLKDLVVVNYRGTSPIVTDLVAGNVTMAFTGLTAAMPLHKSGQLRIIATHGDKRPRILADVPTSLEQGWPDSYSVTWYGVFAPKGTPAHIVNSIAAAMRQAGQAADVQRAIEVAGAEPRFDSPSEFTAQVQKDDARFADMVKRFPIE